MYQNVFQIHDVVIQITDDCGALWRASPFKISPMIPMRQGSEVLWMNFIRYIATTEVLVGEQTANCLWYVTLVILPIHVILSAALISLILKGHCDMT